MEKSKEQKALESRGVDMLKTVTEIKVTSQAKYEQVVALNIDAKNGEDSVTRFFEGMREKAKAVYDEVLATRKAVRQPFTEVKQISDSKMRDWNRKQEKLAAERAAKAEAKRQAEIEANGGEDIPPPPPAPKPKSHVPGITWVDHWKARVNDFAALVKAAAEDPRLLVYLAPDERALNDAAGVIKDRDHNVKGVEFYNDKYQKRV